MRFRLGSNDLSNALKSGRKKPNPTERLRGMLAGRGPIGANALNTTKVKLGGSSLEDRTAGVRDASRSFDGTLGTEDDRLKIQMLEDGLLLDDHGNPNASPILVRDACRCPECIDSSDRQRNFSYADIPTQIRFSRISRVGERGQTSVSWVNDAPPHHPGKEVMFDRETIASMAKAFRNPRWKLYDVPRRLWDAESFGSASNRVDFNDYMTEDDALAMTLFLLWRDGLVFVEGVPESEASVSQIVTRIGPLMNTFYGPTWDVRSVPDAKNVAYTAKYLGFHMDLLYMREPPAFQFLHCIHNESQGGESRFADTLKAVDLLLAQHPKMVKDLMNHEIRYEYDNDGHFYSDAKPTVLKWAPGATPKRPTLHAQSPTFLSHVSQVHWSPPFVGHLRTKSHEHLVRLVSASKAFSNILERPEMVIEEKMDAGTCVIFDNLRVVHARNAFDKNSGRRWLRGAYLARQDFISRASGLQSRFPAAVYTYPYGNPSPVPPESHPS